MGRTLLSDFLIAMSRASLSISVHGNLPTERSFARLTRVSTKEEEVLGCLTKYFTSSYTHSEVPAALPLFSRETVSKTSNPRIGASSISSSPSSTNGSLSYAFGWSWWSCSMTFLSLTSAFSFRLKPFAALPMFPSCTALWMNMTFHHSSIALPSPYALDFAFASCFWSGWSTHRPRVDGSCPTLIKVSICCFIASFALLLSLSFSKCGGVRNMAGSCSSSVV